MTHTKEMSPGVIAGLAAILIVYLLLGVGFAIRTPPWQAPDEPAHYNYIAQIAENGCCPVIEPGDWDQAYLDTLRANKFAPSLLDDLDRVQYEDHQPPLYYLLGAPVYSLTGGSLTALRLLSVVIGVGVVACAFATGRVVAPARPQIALAAAALVAFLPQHVAILASVNNDGLSELVVGLALWLSLRYLSGENVSAWLLGVLAGVGLLVKVNTIFLAGLVPLVIVLRWWLSRRDGLAVASLPRTLVAFALPALALAGVWWARNISVYGWPDFLGLGAHDAVVVGQLRTAELLAEVGAGEYLRRALATTFNSFWGQFGWMALPLQPWMYTLLALFLVAAVLGLLLHVALLRRDARSGQKALWWILALTILLAVAQYIYYNTEFVQFQGRYLYPALIPMALYLALGLDAWRRLIVRATDGQPGANGPLRWLAPSVVSALVALDIYILWRVIPGLLPA